MCPVPSEAFTDALTALKRQSAIHRSDDRWAIIVELFRLWILRQPAGEPAETVDQFETRLIAPVITAGQQIEVYDSVSSRIQTAWNRLAEEEGNGRIAVNLMLRLSMLAPDRSFPLRLAEKLIGQTAESSGPTSDARLLRLADCGFVVRTPDGYVVPGSVSETVRLQAERLDIRLEVAKAVNEELRFVGLFGSLAEFRDRLPHARELVDIPTRGQSDTSVHIELYEHLATYHIEVAAYGEANRLISLALEGASASDEDEGRPAYAKLLAAAARISYLTGRLRESGESIREALLGIVGSAQELVGSAEIADVRLNCPFAYRQ